MAAKSERCSINTTRATSESCKHQCPNLALLHLHALPRVFYWRFRCLQQNKDQKDFGKACRKEVAEYESQASQDYRLNFRLQKECKKDIEALCKDSCPGKSSEVRGNKVGEAVTALHTHSNQACMCMHIANRHASSCAAARHKMVTPYHATGVVSNAFLGLQRTAQQTCSETVCCMTGSALLMRCGYWLPKHAYGQGCNGCVALLCAARCVAGRCCAA